MKKTRLIFGVIILVIIIIASYFIFLKKEKNGYSLAKVSRANVVQEISETGIVKMGDKISLGFKNSGKIEKISVKSGDEVKKGQELAKLDTGEIILQLKEAQAGLQIIQAEKLNTDISLEDVKKIAEEGLKNAYQNAVTNLEDYYVKAYNASNLVNSIKRDYFERGDQESIIIADNEAIIRIAFEEIKYHREIINAAPKVDENIDTALSKTKDALFKIINSLGTIRETIEKSGYYNIVSSTDEILLDNHKTYINTAYTSVVNTQQNISTVKTNNTANINNAEQLTREIENKLTEETNSLFYSKVQQAEAKISLLQNQIQEGVLSSPADGKIIKIEKREGEIAKATESIISFLPSVPFQITADIYEEDIVKVKVDNPVDIKLTAFPDKIFKGKVFNIDPAEKLIDGVVYYEVNIYFEEFPREIKPGMTADITIKTDSKENVLTVPKSAIGKKDDKAFVQILKDGKNEERQIQIGLQGSNDLVEVISGLQQGEEVILK